MVLVNVFVTSPDTHGERRLDSGLTIAQLKDKLTPITGISPQYQRLRLFRSTEGNELVASLDDEGRTLGEYGVAELNCIRVENTDPNAKPGEYSDVTGVDKFELTDEQYEARSDTVLAHLKANKLGRFAPEPTVLAHAPPHATSVPENIQVGERCEVTSEGGLARRGTVRWAGVAEIGNGGAWVGVQLDEPMGKGDGEVDGHRYFSCPPKHAVFVRPEKVTVGDFPEEDLMGDDDDEI